MALLVVTGAVEIGQMGVGEGKFNRKIVKNTEKLEGAYKDKQGVFKKKRLVLSLKNLVWR